MGVQYRVQYRVQYWVQYLGSILGSILGFNIWINIAFNIGCVMRTVCVLCVYICTLTASVQFSRGQPGQPVCADSTDVARTTARHWRPDCSIVTKIIFVLNSDKSGWLSI